MDDPQTTLRVGVIGLGWPGRQHIAAYSALPGVEVVAIAGKEAELLAELGERYGIPHRLSDWEDLLALEDLDAVSVAVPTFLHAPIAIAALARGLHVLSEKPLARNADEGAGMVEAARSAGRVLTVVFNQRRRGDVRALHDIVRSGELGVPYYVRASWLRRRGVPGRGGWFTSREMAGGGPLIDLGVHVLDYSLALLGDPKVLSVSAVTYAELGRRGIGGHGTAAGAAAAPAFEVEDFAAALIRLESGATLNIETSWAAYRDPIDLMEVQVLGSDGGAQLRIDGASETPVGELRVFRDGADGASQDRRVEADAGDVHAGVIEDFVETIRDPARWGEADGSLALERMRVIDACYRSAAEHREVTIDD